MKPKTSSEAKVLLKEGAFVRIAGFPGSIHEVAFYEKDGSLTFYGQSYESQNEEDWLDRWASIIVSKSYELCVY